MRVCHEEIGISDPSYHPSTAGARLECCVLSDDVSVADVQLARLSAVLEILGARAYGGKLKNFVLVPDPRVSLDHDMRTYPVITSDRDAWAYD
jgi:hypothetical protein